MKVKAFVLVAMFFALTGFNWGGEDTSKSVAAAPKKAAAASVAAGSSSSATARAAALRTLAGGDEATRKARLESLTRIGAAMSKKNQAKR